MKNLRTFLLCACITAYGFCASAQAPSIPINEPNPNKPRLFSALPDNIVVNSDLFTTLLNTPIGNNIIIPINTAARFQGLVASVISKYENSMQTVTIRLTNYPGANLTLTKTINSEDGSLVYTGRIISLEHGDLYELQNQNGEYSFTKKKFYELINE
jgi:hypothetical protein